MVNNQLNIARRSQDTTGLVGWILSLLEHASLGKIARLHHISIDIMVIIMILRRRPPPPLMGLLSEKSLKQTSFRCDSADVVFTAVVNCNTIKRCIPLRH